MKIRQDDYFDYLDLSHFIYPTKDEYLIIVNAGCDTSISSNNQRKTYYKMMILRDGKAFLLENTFFQTEMTPNRAYLIGIKDSLIKLNDYSKCKIIVPLSLGFIIADNYKGINVKYIIDVERVIHTKNLDVTIWEVKNSAQPLKDLFYSISLGDSSYKLIKHVKKNNSLIKVTHHTNSN